MLAARFIGRVHVQRLMNTVVFVVAYERVESSIRILRIPKEKTLKVMHKTV